MSQRLLRVAALFMASVASLAQPTSIHAQLAPPPQTPYGLPINIDDAKKVATAAIAEARRHGWNMAIAVVDPGGYLVYFERMPDTQLGSVDLAVEKARTSALFRRPTRLFQDAVAGGGDGLRVLRLTGAIPNAGGIPIVAAGKVIGAIGISGGSVDQDEQIAKTGADVVK
jgi:uncharacterized protein GlcG (DUF336 family)